MPAILHIFGRMQRGGAELRTLEIMRALEAHEFRLDFCVLSGLPGDLDGDIRAMGGEVHYLRLGPRFPLQFCALLRKKRYDAVHAHVHYASGALLRLAAACGVPVRIAHFRSSSDGRGSGVSRRVQRWVLRRWIDRYATSIPAVSESAMVAAWGRNWRCDPRCRVIYNGLDPVRFEGSPDRAGVCSEFGLPAECTLYIHVGRFDTPKNHDRLVEVFAAIAAHDPGARLLLAGRGGNTIEAAVRRRVDELKLAGRIVFAGERHDIPRLLKAADTMIFPSLWEGLPGAVLEACAAGTPVLASAIPVICEIEAFLPALTALDLGASNVAWANTAATLARKGRDQAIREQRMRQFAASIFTLDRCIDAHREIWSGVRPC